MPIIKSAKKRVKTSEVRRERNNETRSKFRTAIKNVETLVHDKKQDEATAALPHAFKQIDLAAKKNVIHKNNAARKKSQLAKLVSPQK